MGKITEALKKAEKEKGEFTRKGKIAVHKRASEIETEPIKIKKESNAHPSIVCYQNISSQISEQYKILRTNILSLNHKKPLKTILITSSVAGEGKTVTALNLASTFAQKENSKVLLLEADLRKPKVHSYMGLAPNSGLSELLSGKDSLAPNRTCSGSGLNSAIYSTELANLKILPAGKRLPSNPPELLGASRMQKFMEELKKKFNYIIIDSPPAISVTDASILGTLSDGVILVIKAGSTNREVVARAEKLLTSAKAQILGFIITMVSDYPRYYIYSHYYE